MHSVYTLRREDTGKIDISRAAAIVAVLG